MQKGFAQTLILLIVLILLISIGAVYWFNFKTPPVVVSDRLVPPALPAKEQIKQSQVYKNESLGFEVTLPEDFSVVEESEAEFHKRNNGDMRKNFTDYVRYSPGEFAGSFYIVKPDQKIEDAAVSIWVFENPENLNPEAFYKKYWYYPFIWGDFTQSGKNKIAPTENFMVGELEATGAAILDRDPKANLFYLSRGDKMYLFRVIGSDNILQTFKFN